MPPTCQPPDPNPRRPTVRLPPGACDAHCHVFGPAARFPYHPTRTYTPPDAPVEKLDALHRMLGLERAVLVQATCHGDDNRAMLDAIARSGGRCRGVAMVQPGIVDEELAALSAGGVRGVRSSHARHIGGAPNLDRLVALAERIEGLGWHLVVYLEADDLAGLADRLARLPVTVVLDHMARCMAAGGVGQRPFRALLDLMSSPNIWVKVSCAERLTATGAPYHDVIPLAQAVIDKAPDRVLWGTDWPHPNIAGRMPNDGDLVDLFARFAPDEALRRQILVDNPTRLYGFPI
jgi:predicted TIM-barrel fold metal-dependent hydrolase